MTQSGTISAKSYQLFTVNDDLVAKAVAAVVEGDSIARRTGNIQSLEIFRNGHRHHLVIGRLMIIPASVTNTPEDFPLALLYGAIVREFAGEDVADLMTHKIGDTEFDEYSKADFKTIKERLFKNPQTGRYDSLVVFIPSWSNPREYVFFRMSKNESELATAIRHMVFGAYFDPAVSSAFDSMLTDVDTSSVDVTDITPKLTNPDLTANPFRSYPNLELVDASDVKTAAGRKPKIALNRYTAQKLAAELEEGETAVLSALSSDLASKADLTPIDEVGKTNTFKGTEGLRHQPDYGEPDSYTAEMNSANEKGASAKKAKPEFQDFTRKKRIDTQRGLADHFQCSTCGAAYPTSAGLLSHVDECPGEPQPDSTPIAHLEASRKKADMSPGGAWTTAGGSMLNTPGVQSDDDAVKRLKSMEVKRAVDPTAKSATGKTAGLEWGISPTEDGQYAWKIFTKDIMGDTIKAQGTAPNMRKADEDMKRELSRMQGFHQGAISQRSAEAKYAQDNKLAKLRGNAGQHVAGVDLTFESIWNDITTDFGPAPLVDVPDVTKTKSAPKSENKSEPKQEKSSPAKEESAPKEDSTEEPKTESPEEASEEGSSSAKSRLFQNREKKKSSLFDGIVAAEDSIGARHDDVPVAKIPKPDEKQPVSDLNGKGAPEAHDVPPQVDPKSAAFTYTAPSIPGQVIEEFYPQLQHEIADYPNVTNTPMSLNPELLGQGGVQTPMNPTPSGFPTESGEFVSTSPIGGAGIGRDGKPEVLDGAPLRKEDDIRGYMFMDEFYDQNAGIPGQYLASLRVRPGKKTAAGTLEEKEQLSAHLRAVVNEIAITLLSAFVVTHQQLPGVPGTSEVSLAQNPHVGSQLEHIFSHLNDSEVQDALNGVFVQGSVWKDSPEGGYVYEIFVRGDSIDTDTLTLKYRWVAGTKS
jgi:hypothetical protein